MNIFQNDPIRFECGKAIFSDYPKDVYIRAKKPLSSWYGKNSYRNHCFHYLDSMLRGLSRESLLIDIGAGNNEFSALTSQFGYVGVDYYPYPDVSIVCDIAKPLPIKENTADIVLSTSTLEHIPNPWDTVKEIHRVLKTGGGIFVGTVPFLMRAHQEPYDFFRFTEYGLRSLLDHAGFTEIEIVPLGNAHNTYMSIQRDFFKEFLHSGFKDKKENYLARFAEELSVWQMKAFDFMFRRTKQSKGFAEGFGFKAFKFPIQTPANQF